MFLSDNQATALTWAFCIVMIFVAVWYVKDSHKRRKAFEANARGWECVVTGRDQDGDVVCYRCKDGPQVCWERSEALP